MRSDLICLNKFHLLVKTEIENNNNLEFSLWEITKEDNLGWKKKIAEPQGEFWRGQKVFIFFAFNQHRKPQSHVIKDPREILERWNIVQFLYFTDEEMNPGERKGLALGNTLAELKIKSEISQVLELVDKDFKRVIDMFQDKVKDSYCD